MDSSSPHRHRSVMRIGLKLLKSRIEAVPENPLTLLVIEIEGVVAQTLEQQSRAYLRMFKYGRHISSMAEHLI